MTPQHFAGWRRTTTRAELLRGGMLLSLVCTARPARCLPTVLDAGAKPAGQDRAAFFLAKIRYQRGLLPEALDALGKIGSHLPPAARWRSALLHANVLLAGQDYAGAAQQLRSLTGAKTSSPGASFYARYNLGVALVR